MLDFGFCVAPFTYKNRNVRFGIDFFKSDLEIPKIPSDLLHYKNFAFNKDKKRVSFTLKDGMVQRCTVSSKLVTTDPQAEKFLITFLEFNPSLKNNIEYYVFDEDGLDIPLFPGKTDIDKAVSPVISSVLPYIAIGTILYFALSKK